MVPTTIDAHSVSEALAQGLDLLYGNGNIAQETSRNGPVLVHNGPVIVHNAFPMRRVLFSRLRNANPFFHLFESLWMLGGRNDLPWLVQFNKQMAAYSDDGGKTQPGAYGHRWREYFGYDQLDMIADELKRNPGTRRCVLTMWDGWGIHTFGTPEDQLHIFGDLQGAVSGSADVPCNTQCYFTARDGRLNTAVTCRSNDILWGAHGANVVHFSILLEYMAARTGLEVGSLFQFSWNYHVYTEVLRHEAQDVIQDLEESDRYSGRANRVKPTPVVTPETLSGFEADLPKFLEWAAPIPEFAPRGSPGLDDPFLVSTAVPMVLAWDHFRRADLRAAVMMTNGIAGEDWAIAAQEWMERRYRALTS